MLSPCCFLSLPLGSQPPGRLNLPPKSPFTFRPGHQWGTRDCGLSEKKENSQPLHHLSFSLQEACQGGRVRCVGVRSTRGEMAEWGTLSPTSPLGVSGPGWFVLLFLGIRKRARWLFNLEDKLIGGFTRLPLPRALPFNRASHPKVD